MNEKRFFYVIYNLNEDDEYYEIIDKEQRYSFNFIKDEWLATQVCDLLNTQQSTINELKSKLKDKEEDDEELRKENEKLREENNFLKQIREAFQIDVKNSRQMLKRRGKYD